MHLDHKSKSVSLDRRNFGGFINPRSWEAGRDGSMLIENIRYWWRAIGEGGKEKTPKGASLKLSHEQGQLEQQHFSTKRCTATFESTNMQFLVSFPASAAKAIVAA